MARYLIVTDYSDPEQSDVALTLDELFPNDDAYCFEYREAESCWYELTSNGEWIRVGRGAYLLLPRRGDGVRAVNELCDDHDHDEEEVFYADADGDYYQVFEDGASLVLTQQS